MKAPNGLTNFQAMYRRRRLTRRPNLSYWAALALTLATAPVKEQLGIL